MERDVGCTRWMVTIDGFRPEQHEAFAAFQPDTASHFYAALGWLSRAFHVEIEGLSRIPTGRALLVANHTFGWDALFPMAAVWRELHRPVWALGEHAWWKVPFVRRIAAAIGTVDGTRENADRLLERDQLVLVQPGGLREAVKPRALRYRLLWGHRYGFVRTAIRCQAPIVPLASIGADDVFDLVGNAYRRGEKWLHRPGIPIPLPSRILPHRVRLRFVFGDPILPGAAQEAADDPAAVRRLRHEVEGALHEMIDSELARRAGYPVD